MSRDTLYNDQGTMDRADNGLLALVDATIRRHHMLEQGDTVVVAVSGGPDSVALLHCLVAMQDVWSLELVVAHLNHQLRGAQADNDAAFVKHLASRLDMPFVVGSQDVKSYSTRQRLSIQEAARNIRYAFYDDTAARFGAQKIALGHQKNDNAESVLMHLLRGTGPRGLAGIPPVRQGYIIRPLLDVTRKQILDFLHQHDLEFVEDQSNLDSKYLRNRVRHELLPVLKRRFNVNVVANIARLATIAGDEEAFWNAIVEQHFHDFVIEKSGNRIAFATVSLVHLHRALLRRLIRHAVAVLKGDLRRLRYSHVEAVVCLIHSSKAFGWIDLPQEIGVCRHSDRISFVKGPRQDTPLFEYHIAGPGTIPIPEIGKKLRLLECTVEGLPANLKESSPDKAFLDLQAVPFPLLARNLRPGDRFTPLGMSGSQKVKDFFINQKVPRLERSRCPLLISHGKIIWVGGHRIDNAARVTGSTNRVLAAELLPL